MLSMHIEVNVIVVANHLLLHDRAGTLASSSIFSNLYIEIESLKAPFHQYFVLSSVKFGRLFINFSALQNFMYILLGLKLGRVIQLHYVQFILFYTIRGVFH